MGGCGPAPNANGYISGPALNVDSAVVEGLGTVRVGDTLGHPKFGPGQVIELQASLSTVAKVKFADATRFLVLEAAPVRIEER